MRRVLEDEQYQVSILQDGRDTIPRVKSQLPDLLILDLKLGDVKSQLPDLLILDLKLGDVQGKTS